MNAGFFFVLEITEMCTEFGVFFAFVAGMSSSEFLALKEIDFAA